MGGLHLIDAYVTTTRVCCCTRSVAEHWSFCIYLTTYDTWLELCFLSLNNVMLNIWGFFGQSHILKRHLRLEEVDLPSVTPSFYRVIQYIQVFPLVWVGAVTCEYFSTSKIEILPTRVCLKVRIHCIQSTDHNTGTLKTLSGWRRPKQEVSVCVHAFEILVHLSLNSWLT